MRKIDTSIVEALKNTNAMLAGGYALAMKAHQLTNKEMESNDIDFFFENKSDYAIAWSNLVKLGAKVSYESDFSTHLRYDINNHIVTVNLVKMFRPHQETIESFDIKNSQFFSFYPFVHAQSNFDTAKEFDLIQKLELNTKLNVKVLNRVLKYYNSKNLNIDYHTKEIGEYLKKYKTFGVVDFKGTKYDGSEDTFETPEKYVAWVFGEALRVPGIREFFIKEQHSINSEPFWIPFEHMMPDQLRSFVKDFYGADWVFSEKLYDDEDFDVGFEPYVPSKPELHSGTLKYINQYFPEKLL